MNPIVRRNLLPLQVKLGHQAEDWQKPKHLEFEHVKRYKLQQLNSENTILHKS